DGGEREALLTADYNAEMAEHIARFPGLRARAIFVGNPEDMGPDRLGPNLPLIRDSTEQHFDFAGRAPGFDTQAVADSQAGRAERAASAEAVAQEIGNQVDYRQVETDGARRAAERISEML